MHKIKEIIRISLKCIVCVITLPVSIPLIIMGLFADVINRYAEVSRMISTIPLFFGECIRLVYYKATLKKVGRKVVFKYGSCCQYRNTYIGNNVLIGHYNLLGEVNIGDDVLMGSYVNITSGTNQHAFEDPNKKICEQKAPGRRMVRIGSDVWIGNNVVIADDIGNRCVVGLGSVVVKKLNDNGVYVGNPAKLIKKSFNSDYSYKN